MKLRNLLFIVLAAIVFCNCQSYQPTSLTVASYNLRNANGSDSARGDGWGQRYPVIAQIVQYHDFDIFGTQECFLHQLQRYRFRVSVLQSPHGPHRQESPCGERFPRTGKDERAGKRQESAGYPDGRLQRRPDPPVLRRICQQRRPL